MQKPTHDPVPEAPKLDLHMANVAPITAHLLRVPGVIVLVSNEDGSVHMSAHGINAARANEMLSIGIYINLDQHYAAVRAGAHGKEASEIQEMVDAKETANVH